MLDDFEHGDLTKYETNYHFVGSYALSITEERAKTGHNSLKLSYHFGQWTTGNRSEEHTSELQSRGHLVCRLLLEKKKHKRKRYLTAAVARNHERMEDITSQL